MAWTLLVLLLVQLVRPTTSSEVLSFRLSRRDIVDKSAEPEETFLSDKDFENIPDQELDLRELGIKVDPGCLALRIEVKQLLIRSHSGKQKPRRHC